MSAKFRVVVAGGGVAAVEGLLRLRSLLGNDCRKTLIAPNRDFSYRPTAVEAVGGKGWSRRYALSGIAQDTGAEWLTDTLDSVDTETQVVHTGAGAELPFDALLVAVGGRPVAQLDHALTFNDAEADEVYDRVVRDVEGGLASNLAFVVPEGPVYPLPVYELALLVAERARRVRGRAVTVTLITSEPHPLAAFGGTAGAAVQGLLTQAGIRTYSSAVAYAPTPGLLLVQPHGVTLEPDQVVALPRIDGPAIRGLPGGGPHGFIPVDRRCCVPGTGGRVFAAGDATAFPVKHGGLGAQQADVAAAGMAGLAGAGVDEAVFVPEMNGKLLTGGRPLYLRASLIGSQGLESEVFESAPWPVDDKVIARELGGYIAAVESR